MQGRRQVDAEGRVDKGAMAQGRMVLAWACPVVSQVLARDRDLQRLAWMQIVCEGRGWTKTEGEEQSARAKGRAKG